MEKVDILVIGGSAASLSTCITARRYYPDAKITVIRKEKEGQVLVPCGIPYVFGTVDGLKQNIVSDAILATNNVDLIVDEATEINRRKKTVTTAQGKTMGYEKLVLATGANPTIIPLPGYDLENVYYTLKDMDYLNKLLSALDAAKNIVIIGGGFIGLEFSDEFKKRGLNVTVVEALPHCLQLVFDEEFSTLATDKLKERGIHVRTNEKAQKITGDEKVQGLQLQTGEELPADIIFMAVGVHPEVTLAEQAGLTIGNMRAIEVDVYGRTSDKDIFAVGDCAEKRSFFTNKPSALRLASIATYEARIVGANLFGLRRRNQGVIGSFVTVIGDTGIGKAGLSEAEAIDDGYEAISAELLTPDKHPASMPGSKELRVKLVFEKATHRILGGQVAGGSTVGEIVNILAVFIQNRMTADEIATFQYGTHPYFTPSPIPYPITNVADMALARLRASL